MTPTPLAEAASPSMEEFWLIVGVLSVLALLLIIGLITGQVSFKSSNVNRGMRRAMMTLDATLAGPERRAAIEYVLKDQDEVVLDQERGEGDGDREDDHLVLFQYPEDDGDADAPD